MNGQICNGTVVWLIEICFLNRNLHGNQLNGTISPELEKLTNLTLL